MGNPDPKSRKKPSHNKSSEPLIVDIPKMLFTLQIIHTLIAVWNYFCLFTMNACHYKNINPRILKVAYISIAIEILAIVPFGFVCPIRIIVDHFWSIYTDDILIPAKIARLIMPLGIGLFVLSWIPVIARKTQFK
jgi:hypothetical protein